jgi:hypothetical protein
VLIVSMEEGEFLLSLNLLDNKEHIVWPGFVKEK